MCHKILYPNGQTEAAEARVVEEFRGQGRGGDFEREGLVAVLERFGVGVASFDGLRSDAYEKHLAARSVAELEKFYATLFDPGLSYAAMQKVCPAWSKDHKGGGRPPCIETLREIRQRIGAEQTMNGLGRVEGVLNQLRQQLGGLGGDQQGILINAVASLLGAEVLNAKFEGKAVSEQLPVVDRLLKVTALRIRERQGDERLELRRRREDREDCRLAREGAPVEREAMEEAEVSSSAAKLEAEAEPAGRGLSVAEKELAEVEHWVRGLARVYGPCPVKDRVTDSDFQKIKRLRAVVAAEYEARGEVMPKRATLDPDRRPTFEQRALLETREELKAVEAAGPSHRNYEFLDSIQEKIKTLERISEEQDRERAAVEEWEATN